MMRLDLYDEQKNFLLGSAPLAYSLCVPDGLERMV